MPVTVILDLAFGDSGKGKISHLLSNHYDVGVRFNGGCNAGHTIINSEGKKTVLHQLPASIIRDKPSILSPGTLVNPVILENEASQYHFDESSILIDSRCPVILEKHLVQEEGENRIGTTRQGIGPCIADQVNRSGIRVQDYLL